ncbi:WGR domain-containing protein [Bradyrhizobium elkanii]|uniref:WGR domain-containing protein n=1 Tax=Bradyrhizobium elkanii TaxID=29448 RepID=UPI00155A445A|nr:WGR domain-containing protein [Bradyrhizobium elkanii]MCS3585642.1 putative DNA-binding WGR domain protein [Bradyrhizobium elkanii]MCS3724939.1 putative DNA-binding WGR domain protein [Bradyrhizobium elkanii]MCS4012367.1 putative DNA-binding WGR domain protein [Bradyrhizobium elkanii USDA 61]
MTGESLHASASAKSCPSRVDAARNMRRFSLLSLQPTLFGGMAVVRNWGRIGTNGQTMMQTFDDSAKADEAFDRLERTKRRRGYAPAMNNV